MYEDRKKNVWLSTWTVMFFYLTWMSRLMCITCCVLPAKHRLKPCTPSLRWEDGNSSDLRWFVSSHKYRTLPLPSPKQRQMNYRWIWRSIVKQVWCDFSVRWCCCLSPKTGKAKFMTPAIFNIVLIRQGYKTHVGNLWVAGIKEEILLGRIGAVRWWSNKSLETIFQNRNNPQTVYMTTGGLHLASKLIGLTKIDPANTSILKFWWKCNTRGVRLPTLRSV